MRRKLNDGIIPFPSAHRVSAQPPLLMIEQILRGEDRPTLHLMRTFNAEIDLPAKECPKKLKAGMRCILALDKPEGTTLINALFTRVSRKKDNVHITLEIRCDKKISPITAIEMVKEDIKRSAS